MKRQEEQRWVLAAQRGDREAFAALVEHYWQRLYRWLYRLTGCSHTAEDLTQEAFLKAWTKLDSFEFGTHFRAWLFRIACNCLRDSRRSRSRGAWQPLHEELLADNEPGPVAAALNRETAELLAAAVARLPLGLRAPFLLRTEEDLSFQEIAQVLELNEQTARWRVFKARQLLLREMSLHLEVHCRDV